MHIVFMILGALAAIGGIMWRIQMASEAARQVGDAAKTAANLPRRLSFRHKTGKKGSRIVTDSREAATILMLEVARAAGDVSREQKTVIRDIMCEHFDFTEADAEEVIVQASWISQDEAGHDAMHRRLLRLIRDQVTEKELVELDSMLVRVSSAEGTPTPAQLETIESLRGLMGLRA